MLRLLAREALTVATLHGAAQLSFRGYRVDARRCAAGASGAFVEITLTVCKTGELLERVCIAVACRSDAGSACRINSLHAPATAVCDRVSRWLCRPG
jgi:hypothetical protein